VAAERGATFPSLARAQVADPTLFSTKCAGRAHKHSRTPPSGPRPNGAAVIQGKQAPRPAAVWQTRSGLGKLQRLVTSSISGQPERIRGLGLGIAGANGRTISGNISSRIATGLGNRETYASPLPSVDLARQEPSNYG
jgi:hypothetical protein